MRSKFINDGSSHCLVGAVLNVLHDQPKIQEALAGAFKEKTKAFMWHTELGAWLDTSSGVQHQKIKIEAGSTYYDIVGKTAGPNDKHILCLRLEETRHAISLDFQADRVFDSSGEEWDQIGIEEGLRKLQEAGAKVEYATRLVVNVASRTGTKRSHRPSKKEKKKQKTQ